MATQTWSAPVTGLTCHGCVETVTTQMFTLKGVQDVHVDLVEGGVSNLHVESTTQLTDDEVSAALRAGGAFALAR